MSNEEFIEKAKELVKNYALFTLYTDFIADEDVMLIFSNKSDRAIFTIKHREMRLYVVTYDPNDKNITIYAYSQYDKKQIRI